MEISDMILYSINKNDDGKKLIQILKQKLELSSGMIRLLKYNEGILLNGNNIRVNEFVKDGDSITILLNCRKNETNIVPNNLGVEVLYEDEAILAVNKPSNMVSHPVRNHLTDTLLNAVVYRMNSLSINHGLHLVSRLDRDTTGIVIIAKNPYVQEKMKIFNENGNFIKKYIGITVGEPSLDSGEINMSIVRKDGSSIERTVGDDGSISITEYKVLERLNGYAIVEFRPKTGRTHQIRVHCLHSNFPLLGDTLYGTASSFLERQALHAHKVEFIHPVLKRSIELIAPLPHDMTKAINDIRNIKQ